MTDYILLMDKSEIENRLANGERAVDLSIEAWERKRKYVEEGGDSEHLDMSPAGCALCHMYYDDGECTQCPLCEVGERCIYNGDSAYVVAHTRLCGEPDEYTDEEKLEAIDNMIAALKKAKEWETDVVIAGSARERALREEMTTEVECFDDYSYENEEIVYHFFRCSLLNRFDCFDFEKAYEALIPTIQQKLNEHGLGTFEDFLEYQELIYDKRTLSDWTIESGYLYIDVDDVFEAIMKLRYDRSRDEFSGYSAFDDLQDIVDGYKNSSNNTLQQDIALFDAIIHAEHVTGNIFEDFDDPDTIRGRVERELKE